MTASVGDLVAGLDGLAWQLVSRQASVEVTAGLLSAWPGLAHACVRALDGVPLPPGEQASSVRAALASVTQLSSPAGVDPDPLVAAMSLRVGAVGDLLSGEPQAWNAGDLDAARALRSGLLAPVYAVARTTVTALDHTVGVTEARWAFRALAAVTEPHALLPPAGRRGRYDDVAAVPVGEPSVEAAIAGWGAATTRSLVGRFTVTGTGLQTAAGDALLLTAVATIANRAATALHLVHPRAAGEAERVLRLAHRAWREPARWPAGVRLDGVRPVGQVQASKRLRIALGGLRDADGWLEPHALDASVGVDRLQATSRRGLHAVARVAAAHYQAIDNLVRGRDRL